MAAGLVGDRAVLVQQAEEALDPQVAADGLQAVGGAVVGGEVHHAASETIIVLPWSLANFIMPSTLPS
ncbi:hypothetical protein GCM10009663_68450 [Kitasatospora arboriphila]|uniref:Uncharacterized protein n=1 Tax=Kitasatospora arboriphila TaxID=258052 RepID=A0ABP4ET87_9ACTN